MADDGGGDSSTRWRYGITAVVAGLVAIVVCLGLALLRFDAAGDITAVLGVVISPIAAIVGAYFGVQVGSAGKADAEDTARKNVATGAVLAAAKSPEEVRAAVQNLF